MQTTKKQLELRRAAERIFKGEMNASKLCVELNADDINDRPISDYAFELIVLFPNDTKKTYPLTFSNKPYRSYIDVDSDLTATAQTLELYVKFTADGVVGRTNTEQLIIYDTPDAEEIEPPLSYNTDFTISSGALSNVDISLDGEVAVRIPDDVTTLNNTAFSHNDKVTKVIMPSNIITAQDGTFRGDKATGKGVFFDCPNLKNVEISPNLTKIGDYMFTYDPAIEELDIPAGVVTIGARAFANCSGLKKVTIQGEVTNIGNHAFDSCKSLKEINLPDSVVTMGEGAFNNCEKLEYIKLPNSLTEISTFLFYDCTNLETLDFSQNVEIIRDSAFAYCSSLISISIPEGVTSIGQGAFANCSSLTNIFIPSTVTELGAGLIYHSFNLNNIRFGGTQAEWEALTDGNSVLPDDEESSLYNYTVQFECTPET